MDQLAYEFGVNGATMTTQEIGTTKYMEKRKGPKTTKPKEEDLVRPHFKIEWRRLAYYKKSSPTLNFSLGRKAKGGEAEQPQKTSSAPKRILNSLDGYFRSGELSAILGPSGAGKSTFLSVLFGSKQEGARGTTRVTWTSSDPTGALTSSLYKRPLRIAFLPQHDHLLHHLTVFETLYFASQLKNAARKSISDKVFHRNNVRKIAKKLKLVDCLDTRCGKLSGGQYKRVSIGQELLSFPDVIILDEPTSGLDAMTCLTTVQTLRSIVSNQPMSIILTIHQPDSDVFQLFDHVYVIAQGGTAIYEGPPHNILPTLASVNVRPKSANCNPARFIVENAFVGESHDYSPSEDADDRPTLRTLYSPSSSTRVVVKSPESLATSGDSAIIRDVYGENFNSDDSRDSDGYDDDDVNHVDSDNDEGETLGDQGESESKGRDATSYLKKSVLSLSQVISGKEMKSNTGKKRERKPLLNIAIQTADGKLVTSAQLAKSREQRKQEDKWNLIRKLNVIQKSRYEQSEFTSSSYARTSSTCEYQADNRVTSPTLDAKEETSTTRFSSPQNDQLRDLGGDCENSSTDIWTPTPSHQVRKAMSLAVIKDCGKIKEPMRQSNSPIEKLAARSLQFLQIPGAGVVDNVLLDSSSSSGDEEDDVSLSDFSPPEASGAMIEENRQDFELHPNHVGCRRRRKRNFDKRLSSKHNCAKMNDNQVLTHSMLLTHRTWLSIIRDPIFFGIQAVLHTTIPLILALIFGSKQEEGCPKTETFDLVKFAYTQDSVDPVGGIISSIRNSSGNIGIMFFEMFVLSFSINCITALVFPLDMHVLLKEYRNGWFSMRSYFIGRTLADLPVPIFLHSLAMLILYSMTGQPQSLWRFSTIVALVILSSLISQSVGLSVGALLMKSSQSAVLSAAGIIAPFFALSGFIVRVEALPFLAKVAAKFSYLYYLLNGFIIVRYGFGRCECDPNDFEEDQTHQVPKNLQTMASIWIGTYSNEFVDSTGSASISNKTNVDPNIDVIGKVMQAFKSANSYGRKIESCEDVSPFAMLDFDLRENDLYWCFFILIAMAVVTRTMTFATIYYKVRSFT